MEANRALPKNARDHIDDLRGASRLAFEATRGVTELVQAVHTAIARGPVGLGRPFTSPVELTSRLVYGGIRSVMQLVGNALDVALAQLAPLLAPGVPGMEREAVLAALNGVLGDYLSETRNPLAIEMQLHHGGEPLELTPSALRDALPRATGKLLVLVHGLCATERRWARRGHDHGAALADDLGYTPIYVRYNTGLHISTNGRLLAAQLEQLAGAWPVPLEEIVLLGHSMGGLVARSACRAGEMAGHVWRTLLRSLITLGTPHHGAPLERGIDGIDRILGISSYSAPFRRLGRIRSAGITDLRYGNVLDEHWQRRDRFAQPEEQRRPLPLPADVNCYGCGSFTARLTGAIPITVRQMKTDKEDAWRAETLCSTPAGVGPARQGIASQPVPSVAWSGGDVGCEAYTGSAKPCDRASTEISRESTTLVIGVDNIGASSSREAEISPGS